MKTLEDILKELMTKKCTGSVWEGSRCSGKGCNGSCALFAKALLEIQDIEREYANK